MVKEGLRWVPVGSANDEVFRATTRWTWRWREDLTTADDGATGARYRTSRKSLKKVPIEWKPTRLNLKHDHWVFTHSSDKKFFKSDYVSWVKTTNSNKFFFVSNSILQALNNSPKIYDAQWGVRIPDPYIESRMLYQLIRSDTSMQTPLDKHYFVCTMKDFSGLLSY